MSCRHGEGSQEPEAGRIRAILSGPFEKTMPVMVEQVAGSHAEECVRPIFWQGLIDPDRFFNQDRHRD